MNDATLIELKILVERAVRPVRASTERKGKVRQELLAHVRAVLEEELHRDADLPSALQRTAGRFGDPIARAKQLQEAVPPSDKVHVLLEGLAGFPPRESIWRRAVRNAFYTFVGFAVLFFPVMLFKGRFNEWPLPLGVPLLPFGFTLAIGGMRQALAPGRRSWIQVLAIGVLSGFIVPGVTYGVCTAISGDAWGSLVNMAWLVPAAAVLSPILVVIVAHFTAIEIRRLEEWAALKID